MLPRSLSSHCLQGMSADGLRGRACSYGCLQGWDPREESNAYPVPLSVLLCSVSGPCGSPWMAIASLLCWPGKLHTTSASTTLAWLKHAKPARVLLLRRAMRYNGDSVLLVVFHAFASPSFSEVINCL